MHIPSLLRRHRILVIFPAAFALTVLVAQEAILPHGSLLEADTPVLEQGEATLRQEGGVLYASRGLLTIPVGDVELSAWLGAFSVAQEDDGVVVAALTTPVRIRRGAERTVVPVGRQWKNGVILELPAHYLREQLARVPSLIPALAGDETYSAPSASWFSVLDAVRFPAAQERSARAERLSALMALQDALMHAQDVDLNAHLSSLDLATLLTSAEAQPHLSLLAGLAAERGVFVQILPFVFDPDLLFLASLHPQTRAALWEHGTSGVGRSLELPLFFSVMTTDVLSEAMEDAAVTQWGEAVGARIASEEQPYVFLQTLLPQLSAQVVALQDAGFPDRAGRYTDAIVAFSEPYARLMDADTAQVLAALRTFEPEVHVAVEPVVVGAAAALPEPIHIPNASELEQQSRVALQLAGGMFLPDSVVIALEADAIRVSRVVLATKNGDRVLDLTFHPSARQVSDVTIEGKTLPYAVDIEQFVAWVRGL